MLEKTLTTDSTLGLTKADVKLTLPVIELSCWKKDSTSINTEIKRRLLNVIAEVVDKQLE